MPTTQVCTRCHKKLPATTDVFSPAKHTKSGLYSWCRKCSTDYQREVYRTLEGQMARRVKAARARAQQFHLGFDLTVEHLLGLWEKQQGCCAVSGLPLNLDDGDLGKQALRPSVDRIHPKKGYVQGNVRLVATIVNFGINRWSYDVFVTMCMAVASRTRKVRREH